MKKTLSLIIALVMIFALAVPASASLGETRVQLIHIDRSGAFPYQHCSRYVTLEEAAADAKDSDVIELIDDVTLSAPVVFDGISVTVVSGTKRTHEGIAGESGFVYTDQNAEKRTVTQAFDGSAFTLKNGANVTFENITLAGKADNTAKKGGLISVKKGAVLNLARGAELKGSALAETETYGGAVFAEKDAKVNAEDTTFTGNSAEKGADIYAADEADVTLATGVTVAVEYGEIEADYIPGDLNDDEKVTDQDAIYLLFHTFFKDDYPVNQDCDFNGDTAVNDQDAIYLLFYTFFPEDYPLH